MFFGAAAEAAKKGEKWTVAGDGEGRLAVVHTDDLADLYLRVAEKVGCVFDIATRYELLIDGTFPQSALLRGLAIVGSNDS
jgi:nucleoside-diphosphate-sugar epimerase